jgi:hypothetical protein
MDVAVCRLHAHSVMYAGISVAGKFYYDFAAVENDQDAYDLKLRRLIVALRNEFQKMGLLPFSSP